ncbi:hypothetical protein Nmel_015065 [Mimus melanotis]
MPELNSPSCSKRCPRTGSTTRAWGWQVGLLWDGCGRNLEHQKHWEEGKEPEIEGEVWVLSCSWPPSTCCSLEDNGCALGQEEDVWALGALLEVRPQCICKAPRLLGLCMGTGVPEALLGTHSGQGSKGASLGTWGSLGSSDIQKSQAGVGA